MMLYQRNERDPHDIGPADHARVFWIGGAVKCFKDARIALESYFGIPAGIPTAFRGIGDTRPLYPHDFVYGGEA